MLFSSYERKVSLFIYPWRHKGSSRWGRTGDASPRPLIGIKSNLQNDSDKEISAAWLTISQPPSDKQESIINNQWVLNQVGFFVSRLAVDSFLSARVSSSSPLPILAHRLLFTPLSVGACVNFWRWLGTVPAVDKQIDLGLQRKAVWNDSNKNKKICLCDFSIRCECSDKM